MVRIITPDAWYQMANIREKEIYARTENEMYGRLLMMLKRCYVCLVVFVELRV